MKAISDTYTLANGIAIPCVGFGTWQVPDGDAVVSAVSSALELGYTHIDTAAAYGNEAGVGKAVRRSPGGRESVFVTSKLWNDVRGYRETLEAFDKTMERLGFDTLDLFLIHWPAPYRFRDNYRELNRETWRAFEELYRAGRVRAIGVSNFLRHHLEELMGTAEIPPMVDQLEFHPGYSQEAAVNYCKEHGILVQAWSPIGRRRVMEEPLVTSLAEKYGVSSARICLKYAVERGVMPIPKASTAERMKENLDLYSFEIEKEDIYRLATMPQAGWSGEHPDRETVLIQ